MNINSSLETERLLIRNFTMEDLETYHRISNEGFGEGDYQERREWMEWTIRNYRALASLYQPPYGDRAVVLKETGELIGGVGLVPTVAPLDILPAFSQQQSTGLVSAEMGLFWLIDIPHRGHGYAVEAAQALIDYAFKQLWMKRIVATTEFDNTNSQAVMRKLRMTIHRNPYNEPFWFQVIGILENPVSPVQNFTLREETTRV